MCAEYRFVILFFLFNLLPRFKEVPRSWKNVLVINVFSPYIHFTIIGLENNVRYVGSSFHRSSLHWVPLRSVNFIPGSIFNFSFV